MIRGEDHLSNTPEAHPAVPGARPCRCRQFAHLPLILNPDRTKMSKRKSQTAVDDYIAQGFIREAFVNYLASSAGRPGTEEEVLSLDEIVARFDLDDRPQGRRGLRSRAARVAQRPVDPAPRRRRPRSTGCGRSSRRELEAGRIDRMPTDEELRALLPIIQERLPTLGADRRPGRLPVGRRRRGSTRRCSSRSAGTRRRRARRCRGARVDRRRRAP